MKIVTLKNTLIGKKVVGIKGLKERKNQKYITPRYILFDDGKTFLQLEECEESVVAKIITLHQNERHWKRVMSNKGIWGDANVNIF